MSQYPPPKVRRYSRGFPGLQEKKVRTDISAIPPTDYYEEKAPEKKSIAENLKKVLPNKFEFGTPVVFPFYARATWSRDTEENSWSLENLQV